MTRGRTVRVEDLLGRRVIGMDGRGVGRIEEIRVEKRSGEYQVAEYLLGTGGVLARWSLGRRLLGRRPRTLVVEWTQLDISEPDHPRLTCSIDEVKKT